MTDESPIGSISGRRDWEWNRRQGHEGDASTRARDGARAASREDRSVADRRSPTTPNGAVEQEVRDLETALQRKDRQLQAVRERYERLLAERNRELAAARTADEDQDGGLLAVFLGWLRGR